MANPERVPVLSPAETVVPLLQRIGSSNGLRSTAHCVLVPLLKRIKVEPDAEGKENSEDISVKYEPLSCPELSDEAIHLEYEPLLQVTPKYERSVGKG